MRRLRILITGSREWMDSQKIIDEIGKAITDILPKGGVDLPIVIVHGHCPTGADYLVDQSYQNLKEFYVLERHPADWEAHGKGAGSIRNQKMVDLGADICLAFINKNSRGTRDCIERAWQAGIPVRVFPQEE